MMMLRDHDKDVALLAEGVDRNSFHMGIWVWPFVVALLAEGVDRNKARKAIKVRGMESPSSRRAWIEI